MSFLFFTLGCDDKRYSKGCKNICAMNCASKHCDAFNGSCIHGCSDQNALTVDCIGKASVFSVVSINPKLGKGVERYDIICK